MRGVIIRVEGDEVDVGVGDVGADDFQDSALAEDVFVVAGELFDGRHDGGVGGVVEVVDAVDFDLGDDESMAEGFRFDVEEGESLVVFVDFVGRQFALDDFGENCAHGAPK